MPIAVGPGVPACASCARMYCCSSVLTVSQHEPRLRRRPNPEARQPATAAAARQTQGRSRTLRGVNYYCRAKLTPSVSKRQRDMAPALLAGLCLLYLSAIVYDVVLLRELL